MPWSQAMGLPFQRLPHGDAALCPKAGELWRVEADEKALLVGFIRDSNGTFAAFNIPDENGHPLWTKADDINDAGVVVGLVRPEASAEAIQGFLRKADGRFFRINIPDSVQSRFTDINNRGEISGLMIDEEGVFVPMLLTPMTPAPNTFFEDAA